MDKNTEIRWHGRGGQGAVVAAKILATAFDREGKSSMAFPKFGFERRGAPVTAFNRFGDSPVREKTQVYEPDCVIVIDPRLMHSVDVFEGMRPNGIFVVDAPQPLANPPNPNLKTVGSVDATLIGLEEIGKPITNTCILGAFARTTNWLKVDSILGSLDEYFSGGLLEQNLRCIRRGYEEAQIRRF